MAIGRLACTSGGSTRCDIYLEDLAIPEPSTANQGTIPLYRARSRPPKGPLRPPRFTASRSESFDPSPYLGRASRLRLMRVQENRACWTPVPTNEPYSLTCSVQERNGLGCW